MTTQTLTDIFYWCAVVNILIFTSWALWMIFAPNLVYKLQTKFFAIERGRYDAVIYAFMAAYKLLIIVFNVVPFIVLKFFIA